MAAFLFVLCPCSHFLPWRQQNWPEAIPSRSNWLCQSNPGGYLLVSLAWINIDRNVLSFRSWPILFFWRFSLLNHAWVPCNCSRADQILSRSCRLELSLRNFVCLPELSSVWPIHKIPFPIHIVLRIFYIMAWPELFPYKSYQTRLFWHGAQLLAFGWFRELPCGAIVCLLGFWPGPLGLTSASLEHPFRIFLGFSSGVAHRAFFAVSFLLKAFWVVYDGFQHFIERFHLDPVDLLVT